MILYTKLAVLAALVLLSAFFSGTEIAFFSISKLKVRFLMRKKVPNAAYIEALKSNTNRLLTTILIGNNLANVGATVLATSIAYDISMSHALSIVTGLMTLLLLVFGEITPKAFAAKHNEKICLMFARPMLAVQTLLSPLTFFFEYLIAVVEGPAKQKPLLTEDELKSFIHFGEEEGIIRNMEKKMMHKIFIFDDLVARDIMVPRKKIACAGIDSTAEQALRVFAASGKTRLPVYERFLSNITGFVNMNDVQNLFFKSGKDAKIRLVKRKILMVHPSKKIDSLLKLMQEKKMHVAIIAGSSGKAIGLVSIEDILEEIVGEIFDEKDDIS